MDKGYYKEYYHMERKHWWFRVRLQIIMQELRRHAGDKSDLKILNVGAATGKTSEALSQFGEVTSVEYDHDCCNFLNKELKIPAIEASITELPFDEGAFDMVCAFDVVEHIEDDNLALREMHRVCKTNGHLFITVPAYMSLWSEHDVINHHFRRYTWKTLKPVLEQSGSTVQYKTYFNTLFFLPILAVRTLSSILSSKKNSSENAKSDFERFKHDGISNKICEAIFKTEYYLLRGMRFPFGVSLMTTLKKTNG